MENMMRKIILGLSLLALSLLLTFMAQAQTSAFSYQGRLTDGANASPTGAYNMKFALYGSAGGSDQIGSTLVFDGASGNPAPVQVTSGIFTVRLDFGAAAFAANAARYLETSIYSVASSQYVTLTPRQQLLAAPFSVRTLNANAADTLSAACVGCVTDGKIDAVSGSKVTGAVQSATNAQQLGGTAASQYLLKNGDGSQLININGASITPNTIPPTAITGGSVAFNPQRFALLRFYDVNTSFPPISVGDQPEALVFDGTFIYVGNVQSGNVARIRAATGTVEGTPISVGSQPRAFGFDGRFVYVSADGAVKRIRAATGTLEPSQIPVGNPTSFVFDGTFVYAATPPENKVTRIRAATGAIEGTPIDTGANTYPIALAFDGTFVYVGNYDARSVIKIRAATGLIEGAPIDMGSNSFPRALAFDGTFVYVANEGSNDVKRIRAATGTLEGAPITIGNTPVSLAFDGAFVYVANRGSNNIMRIRAATGTLEGAPISTGNQPSAIAFDGVNIYVANRASNTVNRF
jgi:DNA-binding beta-propeller fold protein YncE